MWEALGIYYSRPSKKEKASCVRAAIEEVEENQDLQKGYRLQIIVQNNVTEE